MTLPGTVVLVDMDDLRVTAALLQLCGHAVYSKSLPTPHQKNFYKKVHREAICVPQAHEGHMTQRSADSWIMAPPEAFRKQKWTRRPRAPGPKAAFSLLRVSM